MLHNAGALMSIDGRQKLRRRVGSRVDICMAANHAPIAMDQESDDENR